MKFTDEQLSRILSHAHELKRGGEIRAGSVCHVGCVNQAAYNEVDPIDAFFMNMPAGSVFDNSTCALTPNNVLRVLEKAGVA